MYFPEFPWTPAKVKSFYIRHGHIVSQKLIFSNRLPLIFWPLTFYDMTIEFQKKLDSPLCNVTCINVVVCPLFSKVTTFICAFWGGWWALFFHGMCTHNVDKRFQLLPHIPLSPWALGIMFGSAYDWVCLSLKLRPQWGLNSQHSNQELNRLTTLPRPPRE